MSAHSDGIVAGASKLSAFAILFGLYVLGFVVLAWPWLSGAVTIPWDAKSQFQPELQFLASSFARGQSPFWSPNLYAGWPQIADPQSLIFSPLHLALAALTPAPSFREADLVTFAYLFAGSLAVIMYFRDHGWHPGGAMVAALIFAFGASAASRLQHTGQIISLAYLPIALWLMARTLERASWGYGARRRRRHRPAGGRSRPGRDARALRGRRLRARILDRWAKSSRTKSSGTKSPCPGEGDRAAARRERRGRRRHRHRPRRHVGAACGQFQSARHRVRACRARLPAPRASADAHVRRSLRRRRPEGRILGSAEPGMERHDRRRTVVPGPEHGPDLLRHPGDPSDRRHGHRARAAVGARDPLLPDRACCLPRLRARLVHARSLA